MLLSWFHAVMVSDDYVDFGFGLRIARKPWLSKLMGKNGRLGRHCGIVEKCMESSVDMN